MSIRVIAGVLMILMTMLMTWREGMIKFIAIGIGIVICLYIIRKIADLYWYGKDKNEW